MGIKLQTLKVLDSKQLEGAVEVARKERASGFIVLPSPRTNSYRKQIVVLVANSRPPAMYPLKEYVEEGGANCLRSQRFGDVPACRYFRRQNLERQNTLRPSGRAVNEVRVGDQPESCNTD